MISLFARVRRRLRSAPPTPTTTTVLPPCPTELPPGFDDAADTGDEGALCAEDATGPPPDPGPPVSGVLCEIPAASGTTVHLHRHDYRATSPRGSGYDVHGYAWRCTSPSCQRVSKGYEPCQFGRAYGDALNHDCAEVPGG
jgi:hypothetical protein